MRLGLVSLIATTLVAASPKTKAGIEFPSSGVWEQPRIYRVEDSKETEINYLAAEPGDYRFKTQLRNTGDQPESTSLLGQVTGPENFSNEWSEFNINPGSTSTRYWTDTIQKTGDYTLKFSLSDGSSTERNFTVVPEPVTLAFLVGGAGLLALTKKKR